MGTLHEDLCPFLRTGVDGESPGYLGYYGYLGIPSQPRGESSLT
jgi:hypothetical protein